MIATRPFFFAVTLAAWALAGCGGTPVMPVSSSLAVPIHVIRACGSADMPPRNAVIVNGTDYSSTVAHVLRKVRGWMDGYGPADRVKPVDQQAVAGTDRHGPCIAIESRRPLNDLDGDSQWTLKFAASSEAALDPSSLRVSIGGIEQSGLLSRQMILDESGVVVPLVPVRFGNQEVVASVRDIHGRAVILRASVFVKR